VRPRGQYSIGGAPLQIEDVHVEAGTRQIDGKVFAQSPEANEAVTQRFPR
jgi:hypothetical protein